ncbi:MAG: MoaD/ThiS family protein [Candidatus Thorarchaeota archaeon]
MKIKITLVGILSQVLPSSHEIIEGNDLTVQKVLDDLVNRYGICVAEELFKGGKFRKDMSLLINGRNILGMPNKFKTLLKDKDEIIISTYITGG